MSAQTFDFEEFKALKIPEYKAKYAKPAIVKKAKFAIFMVGYEQYKCVMIPFKKGYGSSSYNSA